MSFGSGMFWLQSLGSDPSSGGYVFLLVTQMKIYYVISSTFKNKILNLSKHTIQGSSTSVNSQCSQTSLSSYIRLIASYERAD